MTIELYKLNDALSKLFNKKIVGADSQALSLQGGTVGNVYLVTGTAETDEGEKLPYRIVLKRHKEYDRYRDPGSWRREYDLYKSDLASTFSDTFRWPACYYAELIENEEEEDAESVLWLEYIDGVSGLDLTAEMYEQAALEIGRYQGRLHAEQPDVLKSLTNLSHANLMMDTYLHYRSWPVVYDYVRSEDCAFPKHVRQMFIDLDANSDEIFERIKKLPIVLSHRDYWVTNLIVADGKIAIIDWDTSGWGYIGEDIASLIADEADIEHMVQYYQRCIPAYYRGFSQYAEASVEDNCVYELILIMFGYRLVEWFLHAEDEDIKTQHSLTLQKISEMKNSPLQF